MLKQTNLTASTRHFIVLLQMLKQKKRTLNHSPLQHLTLTTNINLKHALTHENAHFKKRSHL